jgi:hypothetical protein
VLLKISFIDHNNRSLDMVSTFFGQRIEFANAYVLPSPEEKLVEY